MANTLKPAFVEAPGQVEPPGPFRADMAKMLTPKRIRLGVNILLMADVSTSHHRADDLRQSHAAPSTLCVGLPIGAPLRHHGRDVPAQNLAHLVLRQFIHHYKAAWSLIRRQVLLRVTA